jgi:hypothetical protein
MSAPAAPGVPECEKKSGAGPAGEDAPAFAGPGGGTPGGGTGASPAALTARGDQWSDREQLGYEAAVAELTSSSRKAIGSWV